MSGRSRFRAQAHRPKTLERGRRQENFGGVVLRGRWILSGENAFWKESVTRYPHSNCEAFEFERSYRHE